jgi:hypothetical protein
MAAGVTDKLWSMGTLPSWWTLPRRSRVGLPLTKACRRNFKLTHYLPRDEVDHRIAQV